MLLNKYFRSFSFLSLGLTFGLFVQASHAQSWGDVAFSGTLTNNKLCYTDGTDIVCNGALTVNGASALEVAGTVSATAFVGDGSGLTGISDGDWYGLTNIPTGVTNISNTALEVAELQQLQNVDATTVSTAQWGYLGAMNQGVATTDNVTFANIDATGDISATGRLDIASDVSVTGTVQAAAFIGDGSGLTGIGGGGSGEFTVSGTVVHNQTNISNTIDFVFGGNSAAGPGARLMFDRSKLAFRAGSVTGTQWDDASTGAYSASAGWNTTASGAYSSAFGYASTASGQYAFAGGRSTAAGEGATAFGYTSSATSWAFAAGNSADATGVYSVAMGDNPTASGNSSVALGNQTSATYAGAVAMGVQTTSGGSGSVALGYQSTASGNYSFTSGYQTVAAGSSGVALGREAQANGHYSMAFGLGAPAGTDPQVSGASSVGFFMGDRSGENLTDANTFAIMGASGGVGIGKLSPTVELDVVGSIQYTGTIADVSDRRLKDNIQPLGEEELEKVLEINPVTFEMKAMPGVTEYGVIAQEIEEIYPELVNTADDEMQTKSVNYMGLIAPLVKAVQEQQAQIEALKAEVELLKGE